ncbi:MAG: DNA polymerase [Candidatus Gracilibacteria bacterium]|nr:DNA polymerase [Candidatus Gracilibacteria bacterium]
MPFLDIRHLRYLTSPIDRNLDFPAFMDFEHHYQTSADPKEYAMERAYFSYQESLTERTQDIHSQFIVDMESRLLPVLAEMEKTGVYIDATKLKTIGEEIARESKNKELEIYDLVGERFNINSAKQVQTILFEKLKIPVSKKIKTGYTVDNEALSLIGQKYEIANIILQYRTLEKLRSTYIEGLLKVVNPKTKRIHTSYNQLGASTGRLSSEGPNLQNIPSGQGYPNAIKSCFCPEPIPHPQPLSQRARGVSEYSFLVADYSQVELRILASLSGDASLINTFVRGEDIHARTARFLFGEQVMITSELRRIAKSVNFGVIYGITGFGLSKVINTSPAEATKYIDAFYAMYPGVRAYYQSILDGAQKNGYVETFYGRRRHVPGVKDSNKMIRAGAEREAINMPIQGTAADVIKLAMIEIDEFFRSSPYKSRMLLQVHDELVFEVHESEKDELEAKIRSIMEGIFPGKVRLLVDIHEGRNWAEAKG